MPSEISTFVEQFVAPQMQQLFGERDCIKYSLGTFHRDLRGCVLHALRVNDDFTESHGSFAKEGSLEELEIDIPRMQSGEDFQPKVDGKLAIPQLPGSVFTIQGINALSDAWATVRASRAHFSKHQKKTIEHGS